MMPQAGLKIPTVLLHQQVKAAASALCLPLFLRCCLGLLATFFLGLVCGGIECGVGHGDYRLGFGEESLNQRVHCLDALRLFPGEVVLLTQIVAQVEEHVAMGTFFSAVEDTYQLPIAAMHGNGRGQPVRDTGTVRKILEDGLIS
jgi:hypothetical protein